MWLSRAAQSLYRVISPISQTLTSVGGGILAVMMLLTAADVILRYLFRRPITPAYELTELMLGLIVVLGLAYVSVKNEHVRVDFVINRFSQRVRDFFFSFTTILSIGVLALITRQSIIYAGILRVHGDTTAVLHIPLYPFVWMVAVGSAIFAVVLLADLLKFLSQLVARGRWLVRGFLVFGVLVITAVFALPTLLPLPENPVPAGWFFTAFLILMLFSGMHVGMVMGITGFLGMAYVAGLNSAFTIAGTSPFSTIASYNYSVIPMFVLMGIFCYRAGLIKSFFDMCQKWFGRLPGGLAIATIGGCAGFGAVCGSSVATAATLATVALPEMRKHRYEPGLATGVLAAGGSIGSMIPPSILFIIYAVLTEQSMGKMFLAGFLPGIMQALFYAIIIFVMCKRNPSVGPPSSERIPFREKMASIKGSWGILALFILVIGGIYGGVFTVIEAAGIGAFCSLLLVIGRRMFTPKVLRDSLNETVTTTAMCFLILIGTMFFNYFLAVSRIPSQISDIVAGMAVNRHVVLIGILVVYLFLGCIMSGFAMITLTIPIFFPLVVAMGFDPIWFGIIVVRMCEIGVITPPVGINVYVITGIAKDIPMSTVFKGILPFLYSDFIQVAILIAFPIISLLLPNLMK